MIFYQPKKRKFYGASLSKSKKAFQRGAKKSNWKVLLWTIFFALIFSGGFYLLFFSPIFQVRQISVNGQSVLTAQEIKSVVQNNLSAKILKFIPGDRLPVISNKKLADRIKNNFSEISEVEIKKNLPDKLQINIKERKAAAVWCRIDSLPEFNEATTTQEVTLKTQKNQIFLESEVCFFVDNEGIIYRPAPQLSSSLMPTFFGQMYVNLKEQVVSSSTIFFAASAKKEAQGIGIDLVGFLVNDSAVAQITVLTDEEWFIYFDIARSAQSQINVLKALLAQEITSRKNLRYIDLRIANRVYYK